MNQQWVIIRYSKDLDCWLAVKGDYGEWFKLCIGDDRGIPFRLELAKQWYVVMGPTGVKLSLWKNEIYKIQV
jgi:hypothetical protein